MSFLQRTAAFTALVCVMAAAPLISAEITGKVLAFPPASASAGKGVKSLGPAPDSAVAAISATGETVSQGKTNASGAYTLTVPDARKNDVLMVRADTVAGPLRALPLENTADINPVSDALAWKLIESGLPLSNFTAAELKLIHDELYTLSSAADLSGAKDAAGLVNLLLDNPEFNLALGSFVAIYGMQDDNRSQIDAVNAAITGFLRGFTANDPAAIKEFLAPKISIVIGEETLTDKDKLLQVVSSIHSRYKPITMETRLLGASIQQGKAEIVTSEHLRMTAQDGQTSSVDEAWIALNKLEFVNGKWLISERSMPKCKVKKAAIVPDGHLHDWIGIMPCYYRTSEAGNKDAFTAMYFARDDAFLYWRIDLDMKINLPGLSAPVQGVPRGTYGLYLFDRTAERDCDTFVNFITNQVTGAASGGRACVKDSAGKHNETYFMYDRFSIAPQSIEGRIPLEDFSFINTDISALATANRKALPGAPENADILSGVVDLDFE